MTSQLLLALGFTAPFAYAAAVYGLFTFMERQASPQAKQTVSKWIEGAPHTEKQIANLAVYIFDRVYTQPLLGWRPIVRTAIMTLILAFIVVYTNYSLMFTIFAQVPEMRGQ